MSTERITGAEATVRVLEDHGVTTVWGLCGHTVVAVLDALERSTIRFVAVHHEQMAAHAADAQARLTGKAGVVLVHLGPGFTNALTGIANASLDSVPMVVITGNIQSYFFGKHAHMETVLHGDADQSRAAAPFCKRVWRVDRPEMLVDAVRQAFREAETGRPGPVLVDVAMDVFSDVVDELNGSAVGVRPASPGLDPQTAIAIAERLTGAQRPVLYLGEGVVQSDAGPAAQLLAERLGLPIAYEFMGKGAVRDDHPLIVGMTGMWGTPTANAATSQADVLLAVGSQFGELDSSSWRPGATFSVPPTELIHIHSDTQELGRSLPPTIAAVADSRLALEAIAAQLPNGPARTQLPEDLKRLKREFAERIEPAQRSDEFPIRPERLLAELRAVLPEDGIVVGDTGWNKNGVGQQFPMYTPATLIAPGGYATMGFGPAAALGAALESGGAPVVAFVGDGAFMTNLSVVLTAVEERIPVTWVIMNNGTYATISGLQRRHFGHDYGSNFGDLSVDYAAFARSVGAVGVRVESTDKLSAILAEGLSNDLPTVIDVPVTTDAVPTTGLWDINDLFTQRDDDAEDGQRG